MSGSRAARATFLAVTASLAALGTSADPAQAQGAWTSDWNVRCTWKSREMLEKAVEMVAQRFTGMELEEVAKEIARTNCDDRFRPSEAWFSRTEFRASSHWLEGLGFQGPIVKPSPDNPDRHLAWLDVFLFLKAMTSSSVVVDPNGLYFPSGDIYVSPPMVRLLHAVEAHELFHGVQNGTSGLDNIAANWWVTEGTARAVDNAWGLKPGTFQNQALEDRWWNGPLHQATDKTAAYATGLFWMEVGRQLRATDWIGYLPDLLAGFRPDAGTGGSLGAIDRGLAELFRGQGIDEGGLYRAYPEFVRYVLSDPDRAEDEFDYRTVRLDLNPLGPAVVETLAEDELDAVAANAYKVWVRVPPGRMAGLRIEFEQDDAHLHLIVDGKRYNRYPSGDSPNVRNVFATTISGRDQERLFYVRVANVARPAASMTDVDYTLKFTLSSNQAIAIASGAENERLTGGVLFSYLNANRDPTATAQGAQDALTERFADHAGISDDTPEGAEALRQIREAIGQGMDSAQAMNAPAPAPTAQPARCLVSVTIFDDERRSAAKLLWDGAGPFLGGTHRIQAAYAANLHDAVYQQMKTMGQEVSLAEDPEALAQWGEQLRGMTFPGLITAAMNAGEPEAAEQIGAVADLLNRLPFTRSREGGQVGGNSNQTELGRSYDTSGVGMVEIEPSLGDRIVGRYRFTAVDEASDAMVDVEGQFTAVPGPISSDNLRNGCETLADHEEDNDDITPLPAVYPPGEDEEIEDPDFFPPIPPICALFPWLPWCDEPGKVKFPDPYPEPDPVVIPEVTPEEPTPSEPTPDEPTPPEPTPDEPTPDEPVPDEPVPGEPEPGTPIVGDPDPEDDPTTPSDPDPDPEPGQPDGDVLELRGPDLILEFLKDGQSDLRSEPQVVQGVGSTVSVSVASGSFDLGMSLDSGEIGGCGFNQGVTIGLQMLASGRALGGALSLAASPGDVLVELEFDQGTVAVRRETGTIVTLEPDGPDAIRGDVEHGTLELRLDQGDFSCPGLMDFSFTLTEAP